MAAMLGSGEASEDSLADAARERELAAVTIDQVCTARPIPLTAQRASRVVAGTTATAVPARARRGLRRR